ncbi:hypothetical protein CC86DRAFT_412782 [Ophiobolus disseminans]|uniref:Uncharacterized protein n=1 Tax=Ophiobolus disseminans TaxID=1469910 RepID=A0A6A6ZG63_9PLEO|nr:hypothetical protein CC86DRAFT_412782 [Ophiobolus disseminans]
MRAGGKSVIVLAQPRQQQQQQQLAQEMDDSEAIEAFVSCAEFQARSREAAVEVAACDNCEEQQTSGRKAWQDEQAVQAVQEQAVRTKLDKLAYSTCPYCWAIVHELFDGKVGELGEVSWQEQEASRHSFWQCPRVQDIEDKAEIEEIRRGIRYSREVRTCRKCGMMDYLCERGSNN